VKKEPLSPPIGHLSFCIPKEAKNPLLISKKDEEEVLWSLADYWVSLPLRDPNDPEDATGLANALHESVNTANDFVKAFLAWDVGIMNVSTTAATARMVATGSTTSPSTSIAISRA
jgi:hypothetical protein